MSDYYSANLSAHRLKRVYEIASPRIRQYLNAEVDYAIGRIRPDDAVLELGCGYGRILARLTKRGNPVYGIDTSMESLILAQDELYRHPNLYLARMDASHLGFADGSFDMVLCLQNGISAFHCDAGRLIWESLRVTRPGGMVLYSTYSEKFWSERLAWFQAQAAEGLLGEIDLLKTRDGTIVCKDGFTATTMSPDQFSALVTDHGESAEITEVDESALFCEIRRTRV